MNISFTKIDNGSFTHRLLLSSLAVIVIFMIFIILANRLGIKNQDLINNLTIISSYIVLVNILFPELGQVLKVDFIKSPSIKAILYPFLFMPIIYFACNITRFLPLLYGHDVIPIGKNQVINTYSAFSFGFILYIAVFPAVTEEFLFRFLGFHGIKLVFGKALGYDTKRFTDIYKGKNAKPGIRILFFIPFIIISILEGMYEKLFIEKTKFALLCWIIATSTVFSLSHGPSLGSFYIYFVPGLAFAYFYLRYGLLSSMIAHFSSNYFSPVLWSLITLIIKSFLKN